MNKKLGWILPDGRFIECDFRQHSRCAEEVLKMDEERLEKIAIKITKDEITHKIMIIYERRRFTQEQLKTLRKYCIEQGVEPPYRYLVQMDLEDLYGLPLNQILKFI